MKTLLIALLVSGVALAQSSESCPMSNTTDEFNAIKDRAVTSLQGLVRQQETCQQRLQAAAGGPQGESALSRAITDLGRARPAACQSREQQIAARGQRLSASMSAYRATDVSDAGASTVPQVAARPSDTWKRILNYAPNIQGFSFYEQQGCIVRGEQENNLYVYYVNLTCAQFADDVELASPAEEGAQTFAPGGQPCAGGTGVDSQVTQALDTALTTAIALVTEGSGQCQAEPEAAVSVLNLGLSLALSTPVSPLISVIARAGQAIFNGIFGRRLQSGADAISDINASLAERQAQCLYMNLQRQAYGCDSSATNIGRIRERVAAKTALEGELQSAIAGFRAAYPNVDPQADYQECVIASSNTIRDVIDQLNLPALERILLPAPPVAVETSGAAPPPTNVDLMSVMDVLEPSCDAYNANQARLNANERIRELLARLGNTCTQMGTFNTPEELKTSLFNGNRPLSLDLRVALRDIPAEQGNATERLEACLGQKGPERRAALLRIRDLRGRLAQYAGVDQELRNAEVAAFGSRQNTIQMETLRSYHQPWVGNNGTRLSIGNLLQERAENGNPNLKDSCTTGASSINLVRTANELQSICLLNAGAFLNNGNMEPDYNSSRARYWRQKCSFFLNDPALSPGGDPFNSADVGVFERWQCEAITNYETYSGAFSNNQPQRIRELCMRAFNVDANIPGTTRVRGQ